MSADTEQEHDVDVLKALDFPTPCETPDCDARASWIVRWRGLSCCTQRIVLCNYHLDKAKAYLALG